MVHVDYVCVVDEIGNPAKIATGAAKPTTDVRKIMMADYCTQFVHQYPYFQRGLLLSDWCRRRIHRFHHFSGQDRKREESTWLRVLAVSPIPMVQPVRERSGKDFSGYTGIFDMGAIESITRKNPNHIGILHPSTQTHSTRALYVNKRWTSVILAALEVDVNFNCNVVSQVLTV